MMEFADLFADDLSTAVYVYGSLMFLSAFALAGWWMTGPPRAEWLKLSYRRA
jgi:hypothetical protein